MTGQFWVDRVGDMVLARVRGEPTVDLLRDCHDKILSLLKDAEKPKVLYDALEMDPPPVDVPLSQQDLDLSLGTAKLKRAIVVPNTRLAYLARLAFGEGDYRVFYNDLPSAVKWLNEETPNG